MGRALSAAVAVAVLVAAAGAGAPPRDHAAIAFDILPPGEAQSGPHLTDQLPLYDALTPKRRNVTPADLARLYKAETLGVSGRVVRVERPKAGVRILRDRWDVPHVYGTTRANAEFGAGWATAEDRGLYLQLLRGPARVAALDVPGLDAFSLATSGRQFVPSAQTEALLAQQSQLALAAGKRGRRLPRDVDAYLAGVNAYFKQQGGFVAPFTRTDITAIGTLVGAVFGAGGGDEARRSEFLAALQERLGPAKGLEVWQDLREAQDRDTPVTVDASFPYGGGPAGVGPGNVVLDPGSFQRVTWGAPAVRTRRLMSNALLVGAVRSASGHPIFVAGPQVGYFAPEILMEEDLHGGGLNARGVAFPGLGFYLQIGRGADFAWSATSADSDVIDEFAETLCGGDDVHYLSKGQCVPMQRFDAGTLKGANGAPDVEIVYTETVHGPVVGYATTDGKRVAIALDRSTRGRELLSAIPFQELSDGTVRSPQSFIDAMSRFELTFNWFYADAKHIAMYSSGRLPLRAAGVNGGLPTDGSGGYEWRGFLAPLAHVHAIDPPSGLIVNWNNKPGRDLGASDADWEFGSVHRVQLLQAGLAGNSKLTPTQLVAAMNGAATQDLRAVEDVPLIAQVLARRPAPNTRDAQMLQLLLAWSRNGSSRLDADGDGKIDDPGAAVLDAAWPKLADAVLSPVLGPLTAQLAALMAPDDAANAGGSSYGFGWYGYVQKDLAAALGRTSTSPFQVRYCGGGDVDACADSLWAALDAAGNELQAAQGPDPSAWRATASPERIRFAGFLPETMRWTNRPTFQQVISFRSHR